MIWIFVCANNKLHNRVRETSSVLTNNSAGTTFQCF